MFLVYEDMLCNSIGLLIAFNGILVLVSARRKGLLCFNKKMLIAWFASYADNNMLSVMWMFFWFKFSYRIIKGISLLKRNSNLYLLIISYQLLWKTSHGWCMKKLLYLRSFCWFSFCSKSNYLTKILPSKICLLFSPPIFMGNHWELKHLKISLID